MPTYEELLETDEQVRQLQRQYGKQQIKYKQAFAEDWPDKLSVEQEVVRLGNLVANRWDELRQMGQERAVA